MELTFKVAGLDEIKQWIMGLGPEAYVIEPEMLKNMVKAELQKALVKYESIGPAFRKENILEQRVEYIR